MLLLISINIHTFLYIRNTFIRNTRLKLAKKIKQMLHPELLPFENYSHSSSTLSSKNIGHILKNKQKNKYVRIHEIVWLIIGKMKVEMKNSSLRCDISRPRSKHGHKYSKYKRCLTMMSLICIKQHLSNIWSSVYEKVRQHWGWVEKKRC